MGNRSRAGEKIAHKKIKSEIKASISNFSRARAERALREGADPNEERFTAHKNKHVKAIAARKIAKLQLTVAVEEVVPVDEVVEPQE